MFEGALGATLGRHGLDFHLDEAERVQVLDVLVEVSRAQALVPVVVAGAAQLARRGTARAVAPAAVHRIARRVSRPGGVFDNQLEVEP